MRKFLKLLVISFLLMFVPVIGFTNDCPYEEEVIEEIIERAIDEIIYERLEKHTVSIFSLGDGLSRCSGVVISEDYKYTYVLTAKHCIGVTEEVYVENNLVKLIIAPTDEDLAILIVEDKIENKEFATLAAYKPKLGETIYHVAYPKFIGRYESKGTPIRETKDWTFANLTVIGGCSGGGVFNESEELVGIVWGGFWFEPIAVYEPLNDIKTFLERIDY